MHEKIDRDAFFQFNASFCVKTTKITGFSFKKPQNTSGKFRRPHRSSEKLSRPQKELRRPLISSERLMKASELKKVRKVKISNYKS